MTGGPSRAKSHAAPSKIQYGKGAVQALGPAGPQADILDFWWDLQQYYTKSAGFVKWTASEWQRRSKLCLSKWHHLYRKQPMRGENVVWSVKAIPGHDTHAHLELNINLRAKYGPLRFASLNARFPVVGDKCDFKTCVTSCCTQNCRVRKGARWVMVSVWQHTLGG